MSNPPPPDRYYGNLPGPNAQPKKVRTWPYGLGLLVIVVLIFVGCTNLSNRGASSPSDNKYEAVAQCESRVKALLKAPSTAKFASTATGSGANWKVTGTVDAENSFGAMLRSRYGCTVTVHEETATTKVDYFD